jgi:hypothetical protein
MAVTVDPVRAAPDGCRFWSGQLMVAVLVSVVLLGAALYVHVYGNVFVPGVPPGMVAPVPPVTVQVALPSAIESVTATLETGSVLGLVTVIEPFTSQPLSTAELLVTVTVYLNVADPPLAMSCWVVSTLLVMPHEKVRLNDAVAVLAAVRGAADGACPEPG